MANGNDAVKNVRLKKYVKVQKAAAKNIAKFAASTATLATNGNYQPAEWIEAYKTLWDDLSENLGQMTEALLDD